MSPGRVPRLMRHAGDAGEGSVLRRHRPDYQIALYMGLLMLLGLIIMYAIGPQRANVLNNAYSTDFYTSTYFFIKQSISLLMALGAFVVMAKIPHAFIRKHALTILLIGFAASVVLMVAGWTGLPVAKCSLGACRWFNLGPLGSLQPAELLKFGFLAFGAGFLGLRARQGMVDSLDKTIMPFSLVLTAAALFIVLIQKDMGTGLSLFGIAASMLLMAGVSLRIGALLAGGALLFLVVFILATPYRMERVATFFAGDNGGVNSLDEGYQIKNAKIAIGTGGLFGVGVGNSVQATGYLPEAINDSVFAILGETFGFVGLVIILFLFTALLIRLLLVADHLPDMRMKLMAAGVFGWLAAHVFLNVAAMIGVAPLTGITLPLLSFGGTSMVFIAGALGLIFQLSAYTVHNVKGREDGSYESTSSRRGLGRPRYAGRRGLTRA